MQPKLKLKVKQMKTVTMLEFRKNAEAILRRVAKGERFLLSHRGRPAARLEPVVTNGPGGPSATDPFLTIGQRALPSPKGSTRHADIDKISYGRA
jgi:prevent-host-death family protein